MGGIKGVPDVEFGAKGGNSTKLHGSHRQQPQLAELVPAYEHELQWSVDALVKFSIKIQRSRHQRSKDLMR